MDRVSILTFFRAQAASLIASAFDFLFTLLLVEVFSVWYALASVAGNVGGAMVSFGISRFWVFNATHKPGAAQAWKYGLVWVGYVVLNFLLLIVVKDILGMDYRAAKILVAVVLGVLYNYLLQKNFVFK